MIVANNLLSQVFTVLGVSGDSLGMVACSTRPTSIKMPSAPESIRSFNRRNSSDHRREAGRLMQQREPEEEAVRLTSELSFTGEPSQEWNDHWRKQKKKQIRSLGITGKTHTRKTCGTWVALRNCIPRVVYEIIWQRVERRPRPFGQVLIASTCCRCEIGVSSG